MGIKFNPLGDPFDFVSGGSSSSADNFSYYNVADGNTVTIPDGQEMLLKSPLMVNGTLLNYGIIRSIVDNNEQMGHWNYIPSDKTVLVPNNRTMFFKRILMVDGILRNLGTVEAT